MAVETRSFVFTIPTYQYQYFPDYNNVSIFHGGINLPPRIVRQIIVRVPPGPSGQLGFRFESGGAPVIPCEPDQWIIADDETISLFPTNTIESGSWQFAAWNNGNYSHSVFVTFFLDAVKQSQENTQLINFEGG